MIIMKVISEVSGIQFALSRMISIGGDHLDRNGPFWSAKKLKGP
jgi:hypothetical protein